MADNRKNTENTASEELKLGEGKKVVLGEIVQKTLKNVDLVWLGDGDHNKEEVRNVALSKENLIRYAEGGATHVFLEAGKDAQERVDNIAKNPETAQVTTDRGRQIQNMGLLGMEVHCVDPMTEAEKKELLSHPQGIFSMASEDKQGIIGQKNRLEMDPALAANIRNNLPEGEKGIGFYGSRHGSSSNDLDEHFKGNMVKIDVYDNEDTLKTVQGIRGLEDMLVRDELGIENYETGNDHPELVYFTDTGTVHTTQNTPSWLKEIVDTIGGPETAPATNQKSTPSIVLAAPQP